MSRARDVFAIDAAKSDPAPLRCDCGRFVSTSQIYADGTPMTAEEGTYVALCDRCASPRPVSPVTSQPKEARF